ncbi:MAG TPA: hybrid sensor histidine kinase/response regulator [Polyangia bacterium]|nr:hybrid sensor histidine kinase/response regulator [Polyangia bacterium]
MSGQTGSQHEEKFTPLALLSVDDSSDDVELIRLQLARNGFDPDVRRVQTSDEMERALRERSWDVISMDYAMPSFDALAALGIRAELAADTPVIVVSGHIGETAAVSLLKAGADDYIPKHNLARLAPALRRAIRDSAERQARRRVEEERALLLTELARALQVRDEFLVLASHELRTPLAALRLHLESVRRSNLGPQEVDEKLGRADAQIDRIARLVGDMIAVAKLQPSERLSLAEEDLVSIVRGVVKRFSEEHRTSDLVVNPTPERLLGRWDRLKLEDVLDRLLANAIKYGPGQPVEIRVERRRTGARISVTDQGIGIAPADQARIFERFGRAGPVRNYGGLGLGLWIARAVIEAHGGTLMVSSELGQGATFAIDLPIGPETSVGAGQADG